MAGIIVVFDFDKTIIDCDSDNWVIDGLGATHLFDEALLTMSWNSAMDWTMRELHSQGKSIDEIAHSLRNCPLRPQIISAIKSAYALGCELRIVSDANLFFIETILKHHGLLGYFSEINTNPSYVDDEGRLRISPYHDFVNSPHGCSNLCPPNMCKGLIVDRIRAEAFADANKRFIYLGDGKGDYCPCLKLSTEDYVMPRKNYPLWELIRNGSRTLGAEVHDWSDGEELERVLLQIIDKIISGDGRSIAQLPMAERKIQNIPLPAH